MKKINIDFYGDAAYINNEHYEKKDALKYIYEEVNRKLVNITCTKKSETSESYIFFIEDYAIKVRFPLKYEDLNIKYKEKIYKLYSSERKKIKTRLKILSLALTIGIATGLSLSKPGKELVETVKDYYEIFELNSELNDHTGNTYLDGKITPLSEEEHMNSNCAFGTNIQCIQYEIMEYCKEKNLPTSVAIEAVKKYNLLESGETERADEINLYKKYKEAKKH